MKTKEEIEGQLKACKESMALHERLKKDLNFEDLSRLSDLKLKERMLGIAYDIAYAQGSIDVMEWILDMPPPK
jgi:hypothetical protein